MLAENLVAALLGRLDHKTFRFFNAVAMQMIDPGWMAQRRAIRDHGRLHWIMIITDRERQDRANPYIIGQK